MTNFVWVCLMVFLCAGCTAHQARSADDGPIHWDYRPGERLYDAFDGDIVALLECARSSRSVIVVAHRGGAAPGYPENALETFDRVLSAAPVIVEFDVVSSADGQDYLLHDDRLDRTTTGSGQTGELSWSQIQRLRLRDNGFVVTEMTPPRLDQTLRHLAGRAFLMIDLKSPSSESAIVEKVRQSNMLLSTIFIAYDHKQAERVLAAANGEALIALGAASKSQLDANSERGFDSAKYVALSNQVGVRSDADELIERLGHYKSVGSYFGEPPVDAKLDTERSIPELNMIAAEGAQLLVSNEPIQASRYLSRRGVEVQSNRCTE